MIHSRIVWSEKKNTRHDVVVIWLMLVVFLNVVTRIVHAVTFTLVNEERVAFITFTKLQCIGIWVCVESFRCALFKLSHTQIVNVRKLHFVLVLSGVLVIGQFGIVYSFSFDKEYLVRIFFTDICTEKCQFTSKELEFHNFNTHFHHKEVQLKSGDNREILRIE